MLPEHRAHPTPWGQRRKVLMLTAAGTGGRDAQRCSRTHGCLSRTSGTRPSTTRTCWHHPGNVEMHLQRAHLWLTRTPHGLCPPQDQSHPFHLAVFGGHHKTDNRNYCMKHLLPRRGWNQSYQEHCPPPTEWGEELEAPPEPHPCGIQHSSKPCFIFLFVANLCW